MLLRDADNRTEQVPRATRLSLGEGGDLTRLASWIKRTGELHLIADGAARGFSARTLQDWVDAGIANATVSLRSIPIGLATLSTQETALPSDTAEICHLIVQPEWRRRYNGTHLVLELCRRARELGFTRVVGRVVPDNALGHALLASVRWVRLPDRPSWATPDFVWYEKRLR